MGNGALGGISVMGTAAWRGVVGGDWGGQRVGGARVWCWSRGGEGKLDGMTGKWNVGGRVGKRGVSCGGVGIARAAWRGQVGGVGGRRGESVRRRAKGGGGSPKGIKPPKGSS